MHASVKEMWESFRKSRASGLNVPPEPPAVFHFCDNEVDANVCAELVRQDKKRATAPSLWYFESSGERVPEPGDLAVVTNWKGEAQCIIRTTRVEIVPFDQVTSDHATAEGEGDCTLEWWRAVHWDYYHRELHGTGYTPALDMPIVCEQFERVYPDS